jgi:hypothetical protein
MVKFVGVGRSNSGVMGSNPTVARMFAMYSCVVLTYVEKKPCDGDRSPCLRPLPSVKKILTEKLFRKGQDLSGTVCTNTL